MTPQEFIAKWGAPGGTPGPAYYLNEEQGAQSHFLDLCELLDVPKPGSAEGYRFEEKSRLIGARAGYADVFLPGVFAWENKAPGKNLDAALQQLLTYSLALNNPPLLVVSDRLTTRIHTRFTGHPSETHEVRIGELDQPETRALLRRVWTDPNSFRPRRTSRDITEAAARSFATLAEQLRSRGHHPDTVAHFLTQCLFCFFAEDVGLLPARMFERLVGNRQITSERLTAGLDSLFVTMRDGGLYGPDDIPWFNGGLFRRIDVPKLEILDITELRNAAGLNWSAIDVSIFGTLFERGLDPAKRSQLGAHYTDPATIRRLIEPVIERPLRGDWEREAAVLSALMAKSTRKGDKHHRAARERFVRWLERLKAYRVLDPACGSGNFLFVGLKALKDIEHRCHLDAAALGLDREADLVTGPHNVLGIELNEYAAELARVTVWIGELQWRLAHGYPFKTNPVLEPLDHIECRDALVTFASPAEPGMGSDRDVAQPNSRSDPNAGGPLEAPWPQADVVVGNPPFLGDKKMRAELGDDYTRTLRAVYEGRVPGGADLVCYWFEKARAQMEAGVLRAAGLVATNSIRGGKNRVVLDAICRTTRIFEAWSDEGWVNEGAAVRVSLVAFGDAELGAMLDGVTVSVIRSDLRSGDEQAANVSTAVRLTGNAGVSFQGPVLVGDFEVETEIARQWLRKPNPHGRSNSDVLRPLTNGKDITARSRGMWVVDFSAMPEADASLYEVPFEHIRQHVKPTRDTNRDTSRKQRWWLHGRLGTEWREATKNIPRYIATTRVAKHRTLVWFPSICWISDAVVGIARADDTTFGILHSRFHELWSLRMGTSLEDRPRYTPTTCFETFPFPTGLTPADTAHQRTETLEGGAVIPEIRGQSPISPDSLPTGDQGIAVKSGSDPKFPAAVAVETVNAARKSPEAGMGRMSGAISKSEAYEPPASAPSPPAAATGTDPSPMSADTHRQAATAIALAAHRLNALREAWLNPPEWTQRVGEVVPLGLAASPYPDRIEPRPGLSEADLQALRKRTLTNLYNQRPAWLAMAHEQLDAAVAAAYGWDDYTPAMPDEEILMRLLALNRARPEAKEFQ